MAIVHFYLVRHGQTKLNRAARLQGITDSPLTKKGIRMAKRLGHELRNIQFRAVYTSDLKRTQDTAKYILEENQQKIPSVYRNPDLRELSFGRFEEAHNLDLIPQALRTLGIRKIVRAFLNEEHVGELIKIFRTMDGTEQIEDSAHLNLRFKRALTLIGNEYQDQESNILIVTHGLILSNFIESLCGDVPLFLLDNSRASLIDYQNDKFTIQYINQAEDLNETYRH
ncbi:MAG TPA: histidine phosphatase family protein [Candidatus Ligilactobacillus excrementigallinarum]|uniref:Histidine phosphatase family protein n=1 Tax=Candidatus Ligilactobacillus excrementigallinarum TaxID=2838641 RepID=A0A9D1UVY6_9LACO|nr:histidine phosphatase family protein [Candidatus Ligilactobacillus excrementigallinarum]